MLASHNDFFHNLTFMAIKKRFFQKPVMNMVNVLFLYRFIEIRCLKEKRRRKFFIIKEVGHNLSNEYHR